MHSTSIKIGFNGRPFISNKIRGISRYTLNLVKEIHKQRPDIEIHFFCSEIMNREIKEELQFAFFHEYSIRPKILWELWHLPKLLREFNISLYHSTNNVGAPLTSNIPVVVTIHDDITHIHRKKFSLKSLWGFLNYKIEFFLLKNADFYLTVSQYSKNQITKIMSLPKEKIKVIYNGVNLPSLHLEEKKQDYYLYVGGLESRKNVGLLLAALESASKTLNKEIKLICISDINSGSPELKDRLRDSHLKIEILKDISDFDLSRFYLNSKMVIIPSIEEGFGLPVAEAMSLKIPLAVSRIEIFEEVTQKSCFMFDKDDVDELAQLITNLESNPARSRTHVEEAFKIAQKYTWETTAKETILTYMKLLKRS
ncbi:MAG: glycosyltransferase family 1 protein [Bacteriovorax sp.]|jgi:glycosyltransferase involved in cell wall biosynthesis